MIILIFLDRYLQWLVHEQGVDESRYHTFYAISLAKSALKNIQDAGEESEYQLNANSNENCKSSDAIFY